MLPPEQQSRMILRSPRSDFEVQAGLWRDPAPVPPLEWRRTTGHNQGLAMQPADLRPCPFCANDKPIIVMMGKSPAYVIACPECGANGWQSVPGNGPKHAIEVWNSRYVLQ